VKYSIFHTSHCGSTLLSALLSKSIEVYTEPNWAHELYTQENKLNFVDIHHKENTLVKHSSVMCSLLPKVSGKKIFIYNKLYHHLIKHGNNQKGLEFHRAVMLNDLHDKSKRQAYPEGQIVAEKAYLWADRMFHAFDAQDTIFIDCEDLFKNETYVLEKICAFLNIEYIPTHLDFHVKIAGLLHRDDSVDVDKIPYVNRVKKIEPYKEFNKELLEWCYETYGAKGLVSKFIY